MQSKLLKDSWQDNFDIPWSKPSVIQHASKWLADNGVITDFHKNTLIIGVHGESKHVKSCEFFIEQPVGDNNGVILIFVYVPRLFLIFGRKKKLANGIVQTTKNLLPDYDVGVKFKVWRPNGR